MSNKPNVPFPPEESGWYCINEKTDLEEAVPGHLFCAPVVAYWDASIETNRDEWVVIYYGGGGVIGTDQVAVWGQRIDVPGELATELRRALSYATP